MRLLQDEQLDFNDVLILPQRSTINSRKDVEIIREFTCLHSKQKLKVYPIIRANMLTGSFKMAKTLGQYNIMTALHKHYKLDELVEFWDTNDSITDYVFYTLGLRDEDYNKYNDFCNKSKVGKPKMVCIDAPSAYLEKFVYFLKKFRDENPNVTIMAGNVVTGNMTEELILSGADIVKCGIGSGAACYTRRIAGVGRPQLSTIIECSDSAHGLGGMIVSDGGIVQPADVNIAFCAGADFVMIGSLLAGANESEDGGTVVRDGVCHKKFFGMSSSSAMEQFGGGKENYKASEGRTMLVPVFGSASIVAEELQGSTRSMLAYIGARKLKDASKRATLIKVNRRLNNSKESYTIGN